MPTRRLCTRALSALSLSVLSVLSLQCCAPRATPDAAAPDETSLDASLDDVQPIDAPAPRTVLVGDRANGLALTASSRTEIALSHGGAPLLTSPVGGPFLEVGAFAGGVNPLRFHDPRVRTPNGVVFREPPLDALAEYRVTLRDARVGPVTLDLERVRPGVYRLDVNATGRDAAMLRFSFAASAGPYLGLGERFSGVDARGSIVAMQMHLGGTDSGTNETHAPVPFFVHPSGYAVFVETREAGAFDVASSDPTRVTATFEGSRARLWFFTHEDPRELTAMYLRETSLPRLPPAWTYGPQQWRNEWRSRDELFEDARRLRSEHLATTTIWIDNPWQRSYNDSEIDPVRFGDPPSLLRDLSALGYRVLFWSTPYLDAVADGAEPTNTAERRWVEARDRRLLVRSNGAPYVSPTRYFSPSGMENANGSLVDFTAPGAVDFWAQSIEPLVRLGARAFKLDYGEDVLVEALGTRPGFQFASGETERTQHSLYPHGYHRAYRLALDRSAGGDGFVMGRASSWGGQAIVDVLWPGDLDNDFGRAENRAVGGLPAAISAMLSLATSGFPNFASDTGGYRGGRPTKEVLIRWAEHTAFSMVMQLGGGGDSHNPWSYDAETTALYRPLARAHNDLAPYLYRLAQSASTTGFPPVSHASLGFSDGPSTREDPYAYALGDALLVYPIVSAGVTAREVKLPSGAWIHWFTREAFTGGRTVSVPAPLGTPAVFLRAGSALQLTPGDVDTLAERTAPDVVSVNDRASVLRMRAAPLEGSAAVSAVGDATLGVIELRAPTTNAIVLRFTPGTRYTELEAELDLAHRAGFSVGSVQRGDGAALTRAASAEDVSIRCMDCWHFDGATRVLRVASRQGGELRVGP